MHELKHIAIIMDGNGRWAKKHHLPIDLGHKKGAEVAKKIIKACIKFNISYLTLYTFSSENWERSPAEVEELLALLKFNLINHADLLVDNDIKVRFIGNRDKLSKDLIDLITNCEEVTKNNHTLNLQIAFSYGAREEIIQAQKKLLSDIKYGKINIEDLDEKSFENYLYTTCTPDPDLLIRTSGEYRVSNFLLWQIAYTELYFTKTLWPDFNITHLRKAIDSYKKRERRYGLSK